MNAKDQMTNDKITIPRSKIIISGIGTGGHYFPALVVADELRLRNVPVVFLVRKGYLEAEIALQHGLKTYVISPRGFYGKSFTQKIWAVFSLIHSILRLRAITRRVVGLAFGGFGAMPLVISCLINRSPYYLFEANRIPGRATRLFAAKAKKVFLGLPPVESLKAKTEVTGIPIRQEFIKVGEQLTKSTDRAKKILFLGGSQGAQKLNRLALELQEVLPKNYQMVVVSGKRDYEWVNSKRNGRTKVVSFTPTPWNELQDVDVIVSRAGALAGYEILASGRPTIFIPFPFATDNHQYHNAQYFAEMGNVALIQEKGLTKELLADKIESMMTALPVKKGAVVPDAEKRIVDTVLREMTY